MTTPNMLNEFNHAEDPARRLLENLGWTYVPAEMLASERATEREVLLKDRLRAALLRLNDGLTWEQAERVIHDLERADGIGMARNRMVHEYLTYGMPLTVDGPDGRDRTVRFFDFDDPVGGLNEFVVTTQFRVLRGNEKGDLNDDQRVVIPDLVLFVNGIPLVVMEAKSPTWMEVWKTQAVRQLRRYQEAEPQWSGAGAPALFHYNLLCVAHSGAAAAFSSLYAPENAYSEWKSVLPHSEQEVRDRFGEEPKGQAQLIVGLLSPATLLDILRDYVVYELDSGKLIKKLPRYQQYRAVTAAMKRLTVGKRPEECGGVVWHTQGSGKSLTMLWLATKLRRDPALNQPDHRGGHRPQATGRSDLPYLRAVRLPRSRAGHQRQRPTPSPDIQHGPHGDDHHPEVRGGPGRARGRTEHAQPRRQHHRHGRRGAPYPVRSAGRHALEVAAQRRAGGVHRNAH